MRPPLLWISVAFGAGLWAGLDSFPGSGVWGVVALGLAAALLVARGAPVGAAMGVMGVAGLLWGAAAVREQGATCRGRARAPRRCCSWATYGCSGFRRPRRGRP